MRPQISLLVPFRADKSAPQRSRAWAWLREYWSWELPDAEVIIGKCHHGTFSKTRAVNNAAKRAKGRTFVILDADALLTGAVIKRCADRLDQAKRMGRREWYIPYRHLYRLTETVTEQILASAPRDPFRVGFPPPDDEIESSFGSGPSLPGTALASGDSSGHGHRFGAMCQIMPREAFHTAGGMDRRFQGWGGEDVAFVRALDTLWGPHQAIDDQILHLWHAKIGDDPYTRMWSGQAKPGTNGSLASRYNRATGDRVKMQNLIDERRSWWVGL